MVIAVKNGMKIKKYSDNGWEGNREISLPLQITGGFYVCAAFNEMQASILAEQEKNRKYEKARTDMIAGTGRCTFLILVWKTEVGFDNKGG